MARVRVQLSDKGMRELLRSPEVEADLAVRAARVAAAAAESGHAPHSGTVDYRAESSRGKSRARAIAIADHPGAQGLEAAYRTLGTAMDAAR